METIFDVIFSADFVNSLLRVTTPLLFATMAVLVSNKAGVLNIGVEGMMLTAALVGVAGSAVTGSAWIGLLLAIASGMALSWLFSIFVLKLKTDVVLAGIAINLLASGLTIFILYLMTGDKGVSTSLPSKVMPNVVIPGLESIPGFGQVISGQNIMTWFAILSVFVISVFLRRTKQGTYIRAVGQHPLAVETAGINVYKIQRNALLICGLLAAMGGAYMSMGYLSMFTKDMIAGRGFIAIAAEAMGMGIPLLSMAMAFLFGFADALSNNLQMFNVPNEIVRMLPYVITIIALAIYAANKMRKRKSMVSG